MLACVASVSTSANEQKLEQEQKHKKEGVERRKVSFFSPPPSPTSIFLLSLQILVQ